MPQIGSADVKRLLQQYGLPNPTDAEVDMFTGIDVIGGAAVSSIAAYANAKKAELDRQANDPLTAYQQLTEKYSADSIAKAGNLYDQLQSVLTEAPKLFGNLTPDQVQTYLAPLQTSYTQALSSVQGIVASRGLAASSTENAALAQTNKEFQQQVFSTGLDVGMKSQKNRATAMQAQINNLFGFGTSTLGMAGQAAGQKSAQDLGQSNLIASLPYYLRSTGMSEAQATIAADEARAAQSGFYSKFNQVTGAINQGINTYNNLRSTGNLNLGPFGQFGSGSSTPVSGSQTGQQFQSPASQSPGGSSNQTPNTSLFDEGAQGYARYESAAALFA